MSILTTSPERVRLGTDLTVGRIGYGAMHLTGPGMWGPYPDPAHAKAVLRRAVELGVEFIDTADCYGPGDNERIIREALHPYPEHLVVCTKGGLLRRGPSDWTVPGREYITPLGRPAYLRQQVEMSLRNLGVERIDLYQLHSIDPLVPLAEQVGVLTEMRAEGKIRHIGLSGQPEVTCEELAQAAEYADIVVVENLYNVADRTGDAALEYAEHHGIAFIPWFPLGHGQLVGPTSPLTAVAAQCGATASQLALAWLLQRSPATLLIPGTTSIGHLEENMRAAQVTLGEDELRLIDSALEGNGLAGRRPVKERA
ncbi:aldo/keto reductase [Streptomyces sp. FIT100]|uniref:aldo/keto reductase n=1 Tax=Streptomyces sp. FIT100 TaxID=2837956 RepID=UPI0021C810C2|nr:aldo/keto reductase [Streptomyces sp. FIT100]UUN25264.1 aldo/keto reductase [Streptomyces sp. FIT100]